METCVELSKCDSESQLLSDFYHHSESHVSQMVNQFIEYTSIYMTESDKSHDHTMSSMITTQRKTERMRAHVPTKTKACIEEF